MYTSKRKYFHKIALYIVAFLLGALTLGLFSTIQKLVFGVPLTLNLYTVPVLFGGTVGLILFIMFEQYHIASNKYRELFLQSNYAIVLTNPKEIVIAANPPALLFFETTSSEFIGSSFLDRCQNYPFCKTQKKKFEIEFLRSSGEKAPVEVSTRKIKTSMGFIYQRTFRDLSTEKLLEKKQILENQLEYISFLAQGISHDFHNIIAIIMNNLALIIEDLHSPNTNLDQIELDINDCIDASAQAEVLINYLQSLASKKILNKKIGSLHDNIRQTVNFAVNSAEIIIEMAFEPGFPEFAFDPDQINQVLLNLLLNAVESMENKGKLVIKTKIVEFSDQDQFAIKKFGQISIQDQGCGISSANLRKLFLPYFTTKKKGHGLGLAMCQKIVKEHDGFITVDSKENDGTTFSVFLPLVTLVSQ